MSWFGKKENKKKKEGIDLPELPNIDLPKLEGSKTLPQLPSFPPGEIGEKFSQNSLKDAVNSVKKSGTAFEENNGRESNSLKFPLNKKMIRELDEDNSPGEFQINRNISKKNDPVFIRLDKFEEGLQTLAKVQDKIEDIERLLKESYELKQKEEEELSEWAKEIQEIKEEIHEIDENVFSEIE